MKTREEIIVNTEATLKQALHANKAFKERVLELEDELEERKSYIVANPCEQCGGRINAKKAEALWRKLQVAIAALKYINACDSAMQSSQKARETLKQLNQ